MRPIRVKIVFVSVCAWVFGCARTEVPEVEGKAQALVEGHTAQARAISLRAEGNSRGDADFHVVKASIEAKIKDWEKKLAEESSSANLLHGLAPEKISKRTHSVEEATASLGKGVALEEILNLAAERNPEIQAAREHWRATLRRFEQASYLEDLVTRYRAFVRELDTRVGPQTHKEMLAETFPFPSALALKGQMVDLEAEMARLEYRATARKVLNEIARKFFEVSYLGEALAALKANADLFAQMEEVARAQLQAGKAPQSDVLRAQSERAMIETKLATLRQERLNMIAEVNTMLALPAQSAWGDLVTANPDERAPKFDDALRDARSAKQELLKAQAEVRMADVTIRMAETMIYPRGSQGMSQLALGMGAEAGPTRQMMTSFPDGSAPDSAASGFGPNAAWIDELRVRATQMRKELTMVETETEFGVKDALFKVEAARREFETARDAVVPKTASALSNIQERYAAGTASFVEYLDAARASLQASLDRSASRRDLLQSLTDLQDAIGQTIVPRLATPKGQP